MTLDTASSLIRQGDPPAVDARSCPRGHGPLIGNHCERCNWPFAPPGGGFGPVGPSTRVAESDPSRRAALGHEIAAHRTTFDTEVRAIADSIVALEQAIRNAKLAADRLGTTEERRSGRAARSTADELLASVRQTCAEAAQRLELAAWSQ